MIEKLKCCPFCGGKVFLGCDDYICGKNIEDPDYYIECFKCHYNIFDKDCNNLINKWSNRYD